MFLPDNAYFIPCFITQVTVGSRACATSSLKRYIGKDGSMRFTFVEVASCFSRSEIHTTPFSFPLQLPIQLPLQLPISAPPFSFPYQLPISASHSASRLLTPTPNWIRMIQTQMTQMTQTQMTQTRMTQNQNRRMNLRDVSSDALNICPS